MGANDPMNEQILECSYAGTDGDRATETGDRGLEHTVVSELLAFVLYTDTSDFMTGVLGVVVEWNEESKVSALRFLTILPPNVTFAMSIKCPVLIIHESQLELGS